MTKKKTEAAASTDKLSTLRNIIHILRSETVQFIFGLLCIIFSFYLLLAFTSFFFNGGVEEPNEGEDRILVPSPKVATYDLQPEMSAFEVTDKVIEAIKTDKYDVIILNFANADMVGHTGVMEAAEKAVEALDRCVPQIVDAVLAQGGQILLTADHGNADVMKDKDGNTVTAHSLSDVPLMHISSDPANLADGGRLCDIAPTLLDLMGLDIPDEMTGRSLVLKG